MRRIVALTGTVVFLDAMLFGAIIPLLPHFADTYDLSKFEAGLLLGAYGAGSLLGGIPGGLLVGRIGPKRGVLAGLTVLVLASVAFALSGGPVALGLSRFVQGISSATTWAGALAWVAVSVPRERRGQALGTVFGLAVLGFVMGPMFGGFADLVGIRGSFVTVALVAAGLVLALARVSPPPNEAPSPGAIGRALRDRAFVGGLWLNTLPAVFVVAGLVEVVVNPVIGKISDRHGRLYPVRIALIASIAVAGAIAFATEPAVIALLVVAASVSFGGFYTPGMALVADRSERARLPQGIGFGVTNTAWAVGALIGPAIGGALAQALGDPVPYLACAALCALTLVVASRGATRLRTA